MFSMLSPHHCRIIPRSFNHQESSFRASLNTMCAKWRD
jgi:hypothetical protein